VMAMGAALHAQAVSGRVLAWCKFVRYTQQSLALGGGALLVIQGEFVAGCHDCSQRSHNPCIGTH